MCNCPKRHWESGKKELCRGTTYFLSFFKWKRMCRFVSFFSNKYIFFLEKEERRAHKARPNNFFLLNKRWVKKKFSLTVAKVFLSQRRRNILTISSPFRRMKMRRGVLHYSWELVFRNDVGKWVLLCKNMIFLQSNNIAQKLFDILRLLTDSLSNLLVQRSSSIDAGYDHFRSHMDDNHWMTLADHEQSCSWKREDACAIWLLTYSISITEPSIDRSIITNSRLIKDDKRS